MDGSTSQPLNFLKGTVMLAQVKHQEQFAFPYRQSNQWLVKLLWRRGNVIVKCTGWPLFLAFRILFPPSPGPHPPVQVCVPPWSQNTPKPRSVRQERKLRNYIQQSCVPHCLLDCRVWAEYCVWMMQSTYYFSELHIASRTCLLPGEIKTSKFSQIKDRFYHEAKRQPSGRTSWRF